VGKPLIITVNGTGVPDPFGPGFSGDVGRAVNDPWNDIYAEFVGQQAANKINWQPIGYPAAVFPMKPSVEVGRTEVNAQITRHERDGSCPVGYPLFLSGYSQGAIVTGEVWVHDILSPNGIHHNRLNDVLDRGGIINFGDPLRSPGIAHGNEVAGLPVPGQLDGQTTGGIAGPEDLTPNQTPDCLLSCALLGDLYAAAPVGDDPWKHEPEVGKIETRIYQMVLNGGIAGFLKNAEIIVEEYGQPLSTSIALVHAIFNGISFAAKGTNAPHWQYGPFVAPMAGWVLGRI
jgi:hypothetical protein